ncbi:hypothetical protein SK128_009916 [Halocaridina rubra]|uniref:Uncharacterized protein n=1 Tax=Halocaridina rubra TaxID=373956 RepID=A0AAN9A5L3_HALRR
MCVSESLCDLLSLSDESIAKTELSYSQIKDGSNSSRHRFTLFLLPFLPGGPLGVKRIRTAPSPLPASPLSYLDFPLPLNKASQNLKDTINSEQDTSVPSYHYRCIPDSDDPTCGPTKAWPPSRAENDQNFK